MAKEKVYNLAKEFKVSADALIQILKEMGVAVKGPMSSVDDTLRDQINKKFEEKRAEVKKQYAEKQKKIAENKAALSKPVGKKEEPAAAEPVAESAPAEKPATHALHAVSEGSAPHAKSSDARSHSVGRSTSLRSSDHPPHVPGERPARYSSDRRPGPERPVGGDGPRPPRPDGGAPRPYGDRPPRTGDGAPRPWTPRPDGGAGRPFGDRPPRSDGGAPRPWTPRPEGGAPRQFGDRPAFSGSREGGFTSTGGGARGGAGGSGGGGGFINPAAAPAPIKEGAHGHHKDKEKAKPFDSKKTAGRKGGKNAPRAEVDENLMKANVKKTLAKIGAGVTRKKYKKEGGEQEEVVTEGRPILNVSEYVTAAELANMMEVKSAEVIAKCLEFGMFVTINQRLDFEAIELIVDEFGFTAQLMSEYEAEEEIAEDEIAVTEEKRHPVVAVMGHVDHGKTSLLDYIRKTNVIAGEAGGITQHIAAYEVVTPSGHITFLDTPGHEAFTAMRARGSQVTDVVVLVVAADSGVMPQTKEAIDHAKAAGVPIVVAINKVDLPTADVEKVRRELSQYNILVSEWGGQISSCSVSAKTGLGMDKLLEMLALETEVLELKAARNCRAQGTVIEAELDKGKGPIATVLVEKGILRKGDAFVTGIHSGRVRDMLNERGVSIDEAGPSTPVIVLGLSGIPQAGDSFRVLEEEREAREIAARRRLAAKERELRRAGAVTLESLNEMIKDGQMQTINLIVKGDVDGSVEALAAELEKLSTPEIRVNIIHKSVGAIKESDIMLATASKAIIVAFHVNPNSKIRELAKQESVDIRTYRIIYEALDEIRDAMEGMLSPEIKENVLGQVEVRNTFKISKVGTVAGCYVTDGKITRNAKIRVVRADIELFDGKLTSLKRIKDDVKEVNKGYECGIMIDGFNDYELGDRLEVYEEVEVARKLSKPSKDKDKE